MTAAVGLTIIKTCTYRDQPGEEWSNQYWLSGTAPASSAAWRTLFDGIVTIEKAVYPGNHSVVRGYGYDNSDEGSAAVWSVDLTVSPETPVAGTFTGIAGRPAAPQDAAMWVRWKTSRLNSKGKAIYLRKYFHGVTLNTAGGGDTLQALQQDALNAYGAKFRDTSLPDSRTLVSQHHYESLLSHGVSTYVTTRTLKRRGKRPSS